MGKLQEAYRTIKGDNFPSVMTITLGEGSHAQSLRYEKVGWDLEGKLQGLRYGENPNQEAALYKLVNGNLELGDVKTIKPGMHLVSDMELLQSGKHPGKTNITDADNALNIIRYFSDQPVCSIMKHNNPCGVALGSDPCEAYIQADFADRVAAFGGAIAFNKPVDKETAEQIIKRYAEVVVAPDYEEGVMDILGRKKDLRVMQIGAIERLNEWVGKRVLDFKSLIDGSQIVQFSYVPNVKTLDDVKGLKLGYGEHQGKEYVINRAPTEEEYRDMLFGWLVETGITSNSVIYVKDGVTVGIGTGEQDRVGVAKIAVAKAYDKMRDLISFMEHDIPYNELEERSIKEGRQEDKDIIDAIEETVREKKGGLIGATAVSDAFYPYRDGVDVALRQGVSAFIHPGGSKRDYQAVEACNEAGATMVYTGLRSFKH